MHLFQLLLFVELKHLGFALLADRATKLPSGSMRLDFSLKIKVSFIAELLDLMSDDRHIDFLILWLSTVIDNCLENLRLLDRGMPFVLTKSSCEAVFTIFQAILRH